MECCCHAKTKLSPTFGKISEDPVTLQPRVLIRQSLESLVASNASGGFSKLDPGLAAAASLQFRLRFRAKFPQRRFNVWMRIIARYAGAIVQRREAFGIG